MTTLTLLCGLPASGKTTLAREIVQVGAIRLIPIAVESLTCWR